MERVSYPGTRSAGSEPDTQPRTVHSSIPAASEPETRPRAARPAEPAASGQEDAAPPSMSSLRRSLFRQAEKQPGNPNPWIMLGWSSADARSAATYFKHALQIDPENPVAHDGLEWALSELGLPESLSAETGVGAVLPGGLPEQVVEPDRLPPQAAAILPAAPETVGGQAPPAVGRARPRVRDFRWRTLSRFYQIPFFRNLGIAVAYLVLISAAEVITVLVDPVFGVILHALIMLALIVQGSVIQQGPFRRYLIVLALAPLIRLLSLSIPWNAIQIPVMYRYMIVGIPIFLASFFAARGAGLSVNRLYFTWKGWPGQLIFSLVGFLLGSFEYIILRPEPLVPSSHWTDIVMGMLILFVFTGFLEEFIFRSLLQVTGIQLFGTTAIWVISILFGILHIGYFSAFDVIFAGSVGLLFGYFALKTHSLLGISIAHGFTNITLFIIIPLFVS